MLGILKVFLIRVFFFSSSFFSSLLLLLRFWRRRFLCQPLTFIFLLASCKNSVTKEGIHVMDPEARNQRVRLSARKALGRRSRFSGTYDLHVPPPLLSRHTQTIKQASHRRIVLHMFFAGIIHLHNP